MIYLDYAATAPLRPEALEAMLPALKENFGNPDSLHGYGREAARLVAEARDLVAETVGARSSEVYFTSGGTEADNWAVRCLGAGEAVLSPIEHHAALEAASLRAGGARFSPAGEDGVVRPAHIAPLLTEKTGLVCVMAVNNETGCIQPVAELAALAHEKSALFFTDCVQAACSLGLKEIFRNADALSLSAHKLGGPKGVGALVVKRGTRLSPLLVGGEQERGLRGGTVNVAGALGLARALSSAQAEREEFCKKTGELRDLFEGVLREKMGNGVRFDGENRAPNISHVTFSAGEALLNVLDLCGVAASGGAACSAHENLPSHVMLAMGRSEREARRGIRFSFSSSTSREEVLSAAETVVRCAGRLAEPNG